MSTDPACNISTESLARKVVRAIKNSQILPIPPVINDLLGLQQGMIDIDGQDLSIIGPKQDMILLSVTIPVSRLSRETLISLCEGIED
jgi:hypothetical protein